jgi:hypothetical protein
MCFMRYHSLIVCTIYNAVPMLFFSLRKFLMRILAFKILCALFSIFAIFFLSLKYMNKIYKSGDQDCRSSLIPVGCRPKNP